MLKNSNLLKMNLQTFAEPSNDNSDDTNPDENINQENKSSDEEFDKRVNQKVDELIPKKISKYVDKAKSLEQEIEDMKKSQMTDKDKKSYEQRKKEEEHNQVIEENKSLKKQIELGNRKSSIAKRATSDGIELPEDMLAMILTDDDDSTNERYDKFKAFYSQQEEVISKKFGKGYIPKNSTHDTEEDDNPGARIAKKHKSNRSLKDL